MQNPHDIISQLHKLPQTLLNLQKGSNLEKMLRILISLCLSLSPALGTIRKVSNSGELQSALNGAAPGDTVQLGNGVFEGEFVASSSGPITLSGDSNSTLLSEGTALNLKGSGWRVKSIYIKGASIGVLVEGNENVLESVVIQRVGQGVVLRGQGNKVKSVVISEAEGGISVEADKNELYYNSINIQAPSIILEDSTCCGILDGNVANGRVDVKGSAYNFTNNVANHGMYVTGCDNSFMGNVANGASFPKGCPTHDLGGNSYRGLGPNDSDPPRPGQQQQGDQGNYQGQQGQPVPTTVVGGTQSGKMPQCTCTCA